MGSSVSLSPSYSSYVSHLGLLSPVRVHLSTSEASEIWRAWSSSLPVTDEVDENSDSPSVYFSHLPELFSLSIHSLAVRVFDENNLFLTRLAEAAKSSNREKKTAANLIIARGPSIESRISKLKHRKSGIIQAAFARLNSPSNYFGFLRGLRLKSKREKIKETKFIELMKGGGKWSESGGEITGSLHWRLNHFN